MPRTQPTKSAARRDLLEQAVAGGSPLKVDRGAGVIFGVKVLGRYSRNRYEAQSEGTEYSPACMDDAVRRKLYEGQKVKTDHPPDRAKPGQERSVHDSLGVLRNVRREPGADGEPGLYADLHYLKSHPLAESVCEDVERGLGVYGLSHNAQAKDERFDRATRRVVIESLNAVRSVDLVDKPATNRNLWESEVSTPTKTTPRELIESHHKKFSAVRWGWAKQLLEDDAMGGPMDAPAAAADPDEAMWSGFSAAIGAILDQYKGGELDAGAAAKEVARYLKAHDKLTGEAEPEDVEEAEEEEEGPAGKGKKGETMESVRGELARARAEAKARELCDAEDFVPSKTQIKTLTLLESEAERKELIGTFKAAKGAAAGGTGTGRKTYAPPRSSAPPAAKKPAGRDVAEAEVDAEAAAALLR